MLFENAQSVPSTYGLQTTFIFTSSRFKASRDISLFSTNLLFNKITNKNHCFIFDIVVVHTRLLFLTFPVTHLPLNSDSIVVK